MKIQGQIIRTFRLNKCSTKVEIHSNINYIKKEQKVQINNSATKLIIKKGICKWIKSDLNKIIKLVQKSIIQKSWKQ